MLRDIHGRGGLLLAFTMCAGALPAMAQENGEEEGARAARIAEADSIRATLVQPPGDRGGLTAMDVVRAPFEVAAGILALPLTAGFLGYQALDEIGVVDGVLGAREDLSELGVAVRPDFIGSRSWPGLVFTVQALDPFYVEAGYSLRHYHLYGAGVRVGEDRPHGFEVSGTLRDMKELHFWGVGLDSERADRSDYAHEQWVAGAWGWTTPRGPLLASAGAAWERNDVDRGHDDARPDVQETFDPDHLFGAFGRTEFLRVDGAVDLDLTHVAHRLQRKGVRLLADYQVYRGLDGTNADFQRLAGDLRAWVPFSERQAFALRLMAEDRLGEGGAGVPFTHLADLGDDDGLRGYTSRRFMGRAMAAGTAELRYEVWWHPGNPDLQMQGFVFVDHGAVAPSLGALEASDFLTTPGFGLRFNRLGTTLVEAYVAFGGDKTRLDVSLGATF